jgi:hypothetical protein
MRKAPWLGAAFCGVLMLSGGSAHAQTPPTSQSGSAGVLVWAGYSGARISAHAGSVEGGGDFLFGGYAAVGTEGLAGQFELGFRNRDISFQDRGLDLRYITTAAVLRVAVARGAGRSAAYILAGAEVEHRLNGLCECDKGRAALQDEARYSDRALLLVAGAGVNRGQVRLEGRVGWTVSSVFVSSQPSIRVFTVGVAVTGELRRW